MKFFGIAWHWLYTHPQRSMGMLQVAIGSIMTGLPTLELSPRWLSGLMMLFGTVTAVLGFLKKDSSTPPESA